MSLAQHRNRSAYADDADLVFAAWDGPWLDDGDVRAAFYAALTAAGLGHRRQGNGAERFTFHNLRHTFGTTLARGGVDVHLIQRLMGHAHISTTLVYMHYSPSRTRARRSCGVRRCVRVAGRRRRPDGGSHARLKTAKHRTPSGRALAGGW